MLPAGLPSDQLSVENALVITQSIRTVFIIDPSSQAPNWLQTHMLAQKALFETGTMHDERCALHCTCLHCQCRWYCNCSDWLLSVESGTCQLQVDQICTSHASPVPWTKSACLWGQDMLKLDVHTAKTVEGTTWTLHHLIVMPAIP